MYELAIPLSRGDLIAQVHREAQVLIEDVQGDTLVMRARLDEYAQARLRNHIRGVTVKQFKLPPYPYDLLEPHKEIAGRHLGGLVDLSVGTPCDSSTGCGRNTYQILNLKEVIKVHWFRRIPQCMSSLASGD